jgi:regulator of CtrA degradation
VKLLPDRLRELIARSVVLQRKVRRLDATIHPAPPPPQSTNGSNPVVRQLGLLKAAFEQDQA